MSKGRALGLLVILAIPTSFAARACDQFRIAAGETTTVWTGFHVSGKVYYKLKPGPAERPSAWWIDYARLGKTRDIGKIADQGALDIPWPGFAKLRMSSSVDTFICISDRVDVGLSQIDWKL